MPICVPEWRVLARQGQVATAAMPQYNSDMRRLFLFPRYQRDAARLFDAKEQDEMEGHIADDPERHPRIPGGSGMRKARWARPGRGKRGGVRVIYYFAASGLSVLHRRICEEREGESQ